MASKVTKSSGYDYIAHIQKEDGTVVELEGKREFYTPNDVYQWLQKRCREMGGWLISQHITESTDDHGLLPWDDGTPVGSALPTPVRVEVPSVFGDAKVFGEFKRTYTGAIPIQFKPRSKSS